MRFQVTYEENVVLAAKFAPEQQMEMLEQTGNIVADYLGQGKLESFHSFADGHGATMIMNVDSAAELLGLTESVPARAFCDVTTRPLLSFEEWRGLMGEMKKQAAG